MEFKDHAGPVYALHRVFTLNDVDWPHVDARDEKLEQSEYDPAEPSPMTVPFC